MRGPRSARDPRPRIAEEWVRILRLGALPTWTRGTVALLGDAAHAMEANLGQGAAQTIEDAEALLVALQAGGELSGAPAAYATARRRRARMLQRESSRFARIALSTHTGSRDLMMRLSSDAVRRRVMELLLRRHAPPRPARSAISPEAGRAAP
jgi:2-polyprenyl-6-methoxyphenol hydroxylase-like FAD-dependent oxidoreductase